MHIIAIAIIVACLLVVTTRRPRLGFALLGLLLLAWLLFYWLTPTDSTEAKAKPLTDYANLTEVKVEKGYAGLFRLQGRMNNSHESKSLKRMTLRSVLYDCPSETTQVADCKQLAQEDNVLKQFIAAEQGLDFSINLRTKLKDPPEGIGRWVHSVMGAQ